jgi:hypothetical protein
MFQYQSRNATPPRRLHIAANPIQKKRQGVGTNGGQGFDIPGDVPVWVLAKRPVDHPKTQAVAAVEGFPASVINRFAVLVTRRHKNRECQNGCQLQTRRDDGSGGYRFHGR